MKWFLAALGIAAAVLVVAALAALGWLVGTEAGLQWAAGKVPGLSTEALRGRLAGEIAADKIAYQGDGLRVQAQAVSLRTHLAALLGGRLTIEPLRAASIWRGTWATARSTSACSRAREARAWWDSASRRPTPTCASAPIA